MITIITCWRASLMTYSIYHDIEVIIYLLISIAGASFCSTYIVQRGHDGSVKFWIVFVFIGDVQLLLLLWNLLIIREMCLSCSSLSNHI